MLVRRFSELRVNFRLAFVGLLGALLGMGAFYGFAMRFPQPGTADWLGYWAAARGLVWGKGYFDLAWIEEAQRALGFPGGWAIDFSGAHYTPMVLLHNPPPFVLVLLPLGALSFTFSILAWLGLSTALYARAALLFNRALEHPLPEGVALGQPFLFLPFFTAMMLGQIGPLLGALLIFAWYLQRRGHHAAAGALLVPLLLKPFLLFLAQGLLVWVAIRRRTWSFFATFAGLPMALVIGSLLLDPRWPREWLTEAMPAGWVSHSLWDLARFGLDLPVWTAFAGPLMIGGWAFWRFRRVKSVSPRLLAEACLLSILASPFYWNHDITVLLPVALWIGSALWRRGLRLTLVVATLLIFLGNPQLFTLADLARYLAILASIGGLWLLANLAPAARDRRSAGALFTAS